MKYQEISYIHKAVDLIINILPHQARNLP